MKIKHPEAYRFFKFKSELGHEIRIYNKRDGKIPMTIKMDGVKHQLIFEASPIIPDYKLQPGDYFFTNMNEKEIDELVNISIKSENEKLAAKGKPGMNRNERRDYTATLRDHYSRVPIVKMFGKKPESV